MSDFTFLTEEQCFDSSKKLAILKKRGTLAPITDFAILLGGYVSDNYHYNYSSSLEDRSGWYWTSSDDKYNDARVVYYNGNRSNVNVNERSGGARPALPYSSIRNIASNVVRGKDGILEVEYGEYPQKAASKRLQDELERAYNYNQSSIRKTGKIYTTDSRKYDEYDEKFSAQIIEEYSFDDGKKYVRVKANSFYDGSEFKLSNGERYKDGDYVWVEVQPIRWLIDEKSDIALSERLLFAGVQFKHERNYQGDFDQTDIKQFLDNCFSKEIVSDRIYYQSDTNQLEDLSCKEPIRRQNPYNFSFDSVSEEDIIRGAVESKIAVFLHGRSSEGKSARVKELDPDCEIIYMRNATPDSLNGKSVYNAATGEMIDVPPTWYSKVKEKCEAEPDKIHIIFFDELTNALPSIQGMAFNIILDGEVNGKWKLPSNARIVAAGNDLNDSLAANQMAEPLFNRFAHVYINTTVDSWLKWASTPKEKYERLDYREEESDVKIHPSIYAYVAYKSYSGQDVLRTPYTGEKPNADPRKWEMASKVLYKTKKPEMLRALIGEELTRDFIAFVSQRVITVEDVINGNYSDIDLEMNVSEKFATTIGLSSIDEEHFEIVRDFMKQIGAEPRAVFESMWSHGDERRLEKIAEVQMTDSLSQGGIRR